MPVTSSRTCMPEIFFQRHSWASLLTILYLLSLVGSSPIQSESQVLQKAPEAEGLKIRSKPTKGGKKPAAHFEVDSYKGNTILWRNDTDNAFFQGGLSLKDNKVYIPGNGLYYVYTQATFRGRKCPAQSSISHAVLLQSGPYGQVINLLSAQKTACGEQPTETPSSDHGRTQRWSRSIFQGGIFDLEKGDLLYTTTNGQEYLSWTSGESYLGVYAL